MIYSISLVYGILCTYYYDRFCNKKQISVYLLCILPIIFFWILIIGGQFGVGTDYESYLNIFTSNSEVEIYKIKNELLFYYIVCFFQYIKLDGQILFFVFAIINICLFFVICRKVTNKYSWLFLFLYVTVSTLFHNQMNGLRQCTATYFITLALIYLSEEQKKKFFILVLIGAGFHISSLAILLFYPLRKVTYKYKTAFSLLILSALFSLFSFENIIKNITIYTYYSSYSNSEYLADIPFIGKFTKLLILPFYLLALSLLRKKNLSFNSLRLYNIGITAYIIKNLFLISSLTNRVGYFFLLISIMPLFYYLKEAMKYEKKTFIIIIYSLLFIYMTKILLIPKGEYYYNSIFLQ